MVGCSEDVRAQLTCKNIGTESLLPQPKKFEIFIKPRTIHTYIMYPLLSDGIQNICFVNFMYLKSKFYVNIYHRTVITKIHIDYGVQFGCYLRIQRKMLDLPFRIKVNNARYHQLISNYLFNVQTKFGI